MKSVHHLAWSGAAAVALALAFGAASANATPVPVTPSNMGSWAFANSDVNGTVGANPTGSGGMVTGPATPPLGVGSAQLSTGDGTTGGDGAEILSTTGYSGVALSSLTSLSYSTYDTLNNGQQFPYLQLEVETSGGTYDQLFFEPPYQTPTTGNSSLPNQGATAMNTWQSWNVLEGGWWDNNGSCGSPGTGVASLSACEAALPGATIVNSYGTTGVLTGVGGVQFTVGFGNPSDQFNGYVDAFTIGDANGTTTFDFEPSAAVPEAGTWALMLLGFFGIGGALRARRLRPAT